MLTDGKHIPARYLALSGSHHDADRWNHHFDSTRLRGGGQVPATWKLPYVCIGASLFESIESVSISGSACNKRRTERFSASSIFEGFIVPCSQQECTGSPSPVVVMFRGLCSRFRRTSLRPFLEIQVHHLAVLALIVSFSRIS